METTRQRNWRWAVVEELFNTEQSPKGVFKEDKYIMEAYDFWYALRSFSDSELSILESIQIEEQFPTVFKAHRIQISTSLERYFIEAMVMARAPIEEIAEKVGTDVDVIEFYEKLFFDVRDKLDRELYIMGDILGPLFSYGSTGTDYDHLWKAVGYFCGLDALNSLWKFGTLGEEERTRLDNILRDKMKALAACAAFARQPNSYNATEILSDHVQLENLEIAKNKVDKSGNQGDNYLETITDDVLEYTRLALKPHDAEFDGVEKQLSKAADNCNRDDYDRPNEFI